MMCNWACLCSDYWLIFNIINFKHVYRDMKQFEKLKIKYQKQLEFSFVISLLLMIILFYAGAGFVPERNQPEFISHPEIIVIQIPRTVQKVQKRIPKPILPRIPVPSDELELLEEVELKLDSTFSRDHSRLFEGAYLSDDLPYLPRQILEVLPKREENVSGRITLSVRVGTSGYFVDYRVIENTTNSQSCLENVIEAAKKSRWEPILLGSQKVEYWINKTYRFENSE